MMKASLDSGCVKRVVLTSSIVAINGGKTCEYSDVDAGIISHVWTTTAIIRVTQIVQPHTKSEVREENNSFHICVFTRERLDKRERLDNRSSSGEASKQARLLNMMSCTLCLLYR